MRLKNRLLRCKSFPRTTKGSTYPEWVEVYLTEDEEREQEQLCRDENIQIMKECLDDAKQIVKEQGLKEYQSDVMTIAKSLFDKSASHVIYWKENKAKEKFDKMNR